MIVYFNSFFIQMTDPIAGLNIGIPVQICHIFQAENEKEYGNDGSAKFKKSLRES